MGTAYFSFFPNFTLSTTRCNNQTLIEASIKDRKKIGGARARACVCVCVENIHSVIIILQMYYVLIYNVA